MRFFIAIIFIISFISSSHSNAQQDQNSLVENSSTSNKTTLDQLSFANNFKIDFKKCIFRELYRRSVLSLSEPYSTSSNIIIPQGAILETYTHYKNGDLYIIYYNKTWGFIPVEVFAENQTSPGQKATDSYKPPKLLSKNPEKYLRYAFPNNSNGEVLLNIQISNTGAITDITVLKSIPEIDETIIDSLKKLRFKPAKRNGSPVESQFKLPIKYSHED